MGQQWGVNLAGVVAKDRPSIEVSMNPEVQHSKSRHPAALKPHRTGKIFWKVSCRWGGGCYIRRSKCINMHKCSSPRFTFGSQQLLVTFIASVPYRNSLALCVYLYRSS